MSIAASLPGPKVRRTVVRNPDSANSTES